jgi:hypothetical protein
LQSQFGPPTETAPPQFADAIAEMHIDRMDVANALRGIANGMQWLALMRFEASRREKQAAEYLSLADRLDAGEIDPGEEGTEALR